MATTTANVVPLLQKVIAIAVTIIIISMVAIPIINDVQSSIGTETNNSYAFKYNLVSTSSDVLIEYNSTAKTLSVNGSVVYENSLDMTYGIVAIADTFFIQAGSNFGFELLTDRYTAFNNVNWSIQLSGGSWTASNNLTGSALVQWSGSYNYAYIPNLDGDYGYYWGAAAAGAFPVYVNKDAKVIFVRGSAHYNQSCISEYSRISDLDTGNMFIPGTMDSTTHLYPMNVAECTISVDYEELNIRTWKVSGASYLYNGSTMTFNFVDGGFIAPISYTVVTDSDRSLFSLIGVIPILLILVPLMMAVRMIALKRN